MECSNVKCLKPENDRMVTCWLCLNYFHLKCSGSNLRARDADALNDSQKFLNWTCTDCRNVRIEFYNLFKNSRAEFEKINEEFIGLQLKFAKFGELFTKYKNLDKFVNASQNMSPKQKENCVRSVSSQCSLTTAPASNNVNESVHVNSKIISESSTNEVISVNENINPIMNHLSYSSQTSSITPVENHLLNTDNSVKLINNNNIPSNHISRTPVLTSPRTPLNNSQNIGRPLRVIRPNRTIFVSRLASDTTIEDVQYYVSSKCGTGLFTSVYKFSYSEPRMVASFKITVEDKLFGQVMAPEFWPAGTLVREFTFKPRQRSSVLLPSSSTYTSKN